MNRIPSPLALAVVGAMSVGLAGCFGGSSSGSSSNDDDSGSDQMTRTAELEGEQTGSFQDAAVEGLTYWTATNGLGQTNEEGSINFTPGEIVVLYVGNERITLTDAEKITTPLDTLSVRTVTQSGEGHPHQGINVLRLLQTIDDSQDSDTITIPDSFHEDRDGTTVGVDFAQSTSDFATSQPVADLLTEAGKQAQDLVSWDEAAQHFRDNLNSLDNNTVNLEGIWESRSSFRDGFGQDPDPSCEMGTPEYWDIGEKTVFLYGDELKHNDGTCESVSYADQDNSDWEGVTEATRDGKEGVEWDISELKLLDLQCGPACELGELRSTINDWDEKCLADDFDYENNTTVSESDKDYCKESDDHNGPVVEYSEVTYVDRLGGDRLLRIKRDFYTSQVPDSDADRAPESSFQELGFSLGVMDRQKALDHTVDLTEGSWEEKLISDTDTQTVDGGTYDFANDPDIALTCEDGYSSCTWSELNDSYQDADGNEVQYIHIRGTNVINWVQGDTVGTLTLTTDG